MMRHFLLLLLLIFPLFGLFGCDKPDPNPELKDYIYNDLNIMKTSLDARVIEAEEKIKKQEEELKSEERDYYSKRLGTKLVLMKRDLDRIKQEARYIKIRIDSRKKFVRKAYLEARSQGKELDTKVETDAYMQIKELRQKIVEKRKGEDPKEEKPEGEGEAKEEEAHAKE